MATTIGEDIYATLNQVNEASLTSTVIDSWMARIEKHALSLEPRLTGDDLYQVKFQLGKAEAEEFLGSSGELWHTKAQALARAAGKRYDNVKQSQGVPNLRGQGDADIVTVVEIPDFLWED